MRSNHAMQTTGSTWLQGKLGIGRGDFSSFLDWWRNFGLESITWNFMTYQCLRLRENTNKQSHMFTRYFQCVLYFHCQISELIHCSARIPLKSVLGLFDVGFSKFLLMFYFFFNFCKFFLEHHSCSQRFTNSFWGYCINWKKQSFRTCEYPELRSWNSSAHVVFRICAPNTS